jgi:hypothetical protein
MTQEQYDNAERDLVARLQAMREAECGSRVLIEKQSGSQQDELDDVYDQPISNEHQEAYNEWTNYCRIVKSGRKFPKKFKNNSNLINIGMITFGAVDERGEDMEVTGSFFKKCNLADFINTEGYFDLVSFVGHNKQSFPYIYKLACCLASLRTNEVGCERFFSIAGYVSNPRRTKLNVKNYEMIAMLKRNMQQVYIDEDFVVKEYMTHEKNKTWNGMDTTNDVMVTNLERLLYAEDLGMAVGDLPDTFADDFVEPSEVVELSDSDTDSESSG